MMNHNRLLLFSQLKWGTFQGHTFYNDFARSVLLRHLNNIIRNWISNHRKDDLTELTENNFNYFNMIRLYSSVHHHFLSYLLVSEIIVWGWLWKKFLPLTAFICLFNSMIYQTNEMNMDKKFIWRTCFGHIILPKNVRLPHFWIV